MGEDGEEENCQQCGVELVVPVLVGALCGCWLCDDGKGWINGPKMILSFAALVS